MRLTSLCLVSIITAINCLAISSVQAALVAHWPLNDGPVSSSVTGADDVIDDASHPATDATLSGSGATWVNDASRGIVFSTGEDDRLQAGTQGIDRNVGFTWHGWVNAASSNLSDTGADVLLGTRASSGGNWHKLQPTGISNWADISGYDVADDSWHHLGYVGDSTSVRLYVDGVLVGQDTTTPSTTFNGNFEMGGSSQFGEDSTALMSDVAIWEEALTADEIKSLYDISNSTGLLYNAGEFDLLKQLHDTGSGSVDIGGLTWEYAEGLMGDAGLTGGGNSFALILDSGADTGLRVFAQVPEPSTAFMAALGLIGMVKLRRRSRRTQVI